MKPVNECWWVPCCLPPREIMPVCTSLHFDLSATKVAEALVSPPLRFRPSSGPSALSRTYTSIFGIYPTEMLIFTAPKTGMETGERRFCLWLRMRQFKNLLPLPGGGRGRRGSRTTPGRQTGTCGRCWTRSPAASCTGPFSPLLRNDNRESGDLVMDDAIRGFVEELFLWTIANMARPTITVAVLGKEAYAKSCWPSACLPKGPCGRTATCPVNHSLRPFPGRKSLSSH